MEFKKKYGPWALIAGASEGLGAAIADEAAARGCNVVLVARTESKLAAVAEAIEKKHQVETRILPLDLYGPNAAQEVIDGVADLEVGFFVYNAAAEPRGYFLDTPDEDLVNNVYMNCTVPSLITKALGQKMVDRGRGGIVLCSSGGALQGLRVFAAYGAAKAYELILAEGLWDELKDSGVDVMGYIIGVTLTPAYRRNHNPGPQEEAEMRKMGAQSPEECAARLYEVFGKGPRGYANDMMEQKFISDAKLTRQEVITTLGEHMQATFG